MVESPVSNSTNRQASVSRHAKSVKEALRRGRTFADRRQDDERARNIAKKVLSSDRSKAVEYVVTLVVDIAHRGSLEDAEAIGQHLIAIARSEHAAAHPDGTRVQLSRAEAMLAEEAAEGDVEQAETALALEPTLGNMLRYLGASARHSRARRDLDEAVRREVAAQ